MWRALVAVCIAGGVAQADDAKGVDAAIRNVLDGRQTWEVAAGKPGWYERLAGVKLAGPSGAPIEGKNDLERELTDCPIIEAVWQLGAIASGVDTKRGFAWFQAPVEVDVMCTTAGFAPPTAHDKLRASGILVRDKAKWRLVALALSRPFPDSELFKGATRSPAFDTPRLDDSAAAAGAKLWFAKGGFERGKARDAVASGTDPDEYASGAGAARLAARWDQLGLRADSLEAIAFAGGAVALIRAGVPLPVKKKAAPMTLYAIAILDGTVWRWVSLQFTSELAAAPHAEVPDVSGIECPNGKC
jgi:hypothetical protein